MPEVSGLEILERGEATPGVPSLVFVHGYWQAAWAWDEYVLPALEGLGHHCVAVSLRGHGGSEGSIRGAAIRDYVEDVAQVVGTLAEPPVIVGHSMGGFTTQHYLEAGHPAVAAILVSPVPRKGAWGATFKAVAAHPWLFLKTNLTLDVGAVVETEEAAHDFLVSPNVPREELSKYMPRLERASYRAYMDLLLNRPDLSRVDVPVLIVGGTDDGFFTEAEWSNTAASCAGELVILDGIGHQPMWEGRGEKLVEVIHDFVSSLTGPQS